MTGLVPSRRWSRRVVVRLGVLASATVVTAVLALVLFPGNTAAPPPSLAGPDAAGPSMVPATRDAAVDMADPEQVCRGFAAALFTTTASDDPNDPYRRAAAYTTATLAEALAAGQGRRPWSPPTRAATGEPMVDGYTGDHLVPDTEQVAHRAAVVTIITTTEAEQRHVVYCTLHRTGRTWLVAAYERERTP